MKTYECIAHNGNTGKQIVVFVRAISSTNAQMDALKQVRQQFGPFYQEFGSFDMP